MGLWFFHEVVSFVLAAMLEGMLGKSGTIYVPMKYLPHALALQHDGQNYYLLIFCSTFDSYAQMRCKRYHIIFSTFSLKLSAKFVFRER